jgi:hypothetical protein
VNLVIIGEQPILQLVMEFPAFGASFEILNLILWGHWAQGTESVHVFEGFWHPSQDVKKTVMSRLDSAPPRYCLPCMFVQD